MAILLAAAGVSLCGYALWAWEKERISGRTFIGCQVAMLVLVATAFLSLVFAVFAIG